MTTSSPTRLEPLLCLSLVPCKPCNLYNIPRSTYFFVCGCGFIDGYPHALLPFTQSPCLKVSPSHSFFVFVSALAFTCITNTVD